MIFNPLRPGKSVYEKEIPAFQSETKGKKYLYLIAGTHGDEVEGVFVLQKLFEWLQEDDNEVDALPIIVVPVLNVDGHEAGSRVNAHAVDLNRNYPTENWSAEFSEDKYNPGPEPLSEPENKFLVKLLEKFPPYLIISFHSWKPILNYNGDSFKEAEYISEFNNYPVQDDIGYPTPGSFGTYVPEKFNAGVITYECPLLADGKSLKEIWEENEEGLKHFMKSHLLEDLKEFIK